MELQGDAIGRYYRASRLRHEFVARCQQSAISHVSFDLFDTLLRRHCGEPQAIFDQVAVAAAAELSRWGIDPDSYRSLRIEAERQARRVTQAEEIAFADIFAQLHWLPVALRQQLAELELASERANLYRDPLAWQLLAEAQALGRPLLLISDMYLPEAFVRELLAPWLAPTEYQLFLSSSWGTTKASAGLFRLIFDQLAIAPGALLHVGDHPHADLRVPEGLGCALLPFAESPPQLERGRREALLGAGLSAAGVQTRRWSLLAQPAGLDEAQQQLFTLGAGVFGPALHGFCHWVITQAQRVGSRHIVALMREGELLADCLAALLGRDSNLRISCCYVSRLSTYLPSMARLDIGLLLDGFCRRQRACVADLLAELELEVLSDAYAQDLDCPLAQLRSRERDGVSLYDRLQQDLHLHQAALQQCLSERRALLNDYLTALLGDEPYVTVDLGASGTIQHQLAALASPAARLNLVFYGNELLEQRRLALPFASYLPARPELQGALALFSRSPQVLEIPLVGCRGTTLGYRRHADGSVMPVVEERRLPSTQIVQLQAFRDGVLAFSHWAEAAQLAPLSASASARLLERLISLPDAAEARLLGALLHEENFGSRGGEPLISPRVLQQIEKIGIDRYWQDYLLDPNRDLGQIYWPQGAITCLDPGWLILRRQGLSAADKHGRTVRLLLQRISAARCSEVVVYGAGELFSALLPELRAAGITISAVVDKRAQQSAFTAHGYRVCWLDQLQPQPQQRVVIASMAYLTDMVASVRCWNPAALIISGEAGS